MAKIEKKIAKLFYEKLCKSNEWKDFLGPGLQKHEDELIQKMDNQPGFVNKMINKAIQAIKSNPIEKVKENRKPSKIVHPNDHEFLETTEAKSGIEQWETKKFLNTITNTLPGIISIYDAEKHKHVYCNDFIYPMLGYEKHLFLEGLLHYTDILHPDDIQPVQALTIKFLKSESKKDINSRRVFTFEVRLKTISGNWKWIKNSTVVLEKSHNNRIKFILTISQDISDLKKTEEELKKNRSFLRNIIDASPNLVFTKNRKGKFILANKTLANLYGTDIDSMLGKTDLDFNPHNDLVKNYLKDDLEVMNSQKPKFVEKELFVDNKGVVHWFQTLKIPIEFKNGVARQVLGFSTDITKLIETQEQLIESKQLLERITETVPAIISFYDFNTGVYKFINKSFTRILGYSTEEVYQGGVDFINSIIHPKDLENINKQIERNIKTGRWSSPDFNNIFEYRIKHQNGQWKWIRTYATIFSIHEDNTTKEVLTVSQDISEQRAIEKQIDQFFELNDDLFVISRTDGYFLKINQAWEKTLGYSRDEILSLPFLEFIHPDDVESTAKEFEEILKGKITISFTNRYKTKNDEYRWLSWTSRYNPDEDLVYASARDITEKKALDVMLEESEEKYRSLTELSPIGIGVHRHGKIIYTNPKAIEIMGAKSQDELVGQPVLKFVHPDYKEMVIERVQNMMQGKDQLDIVEEKFIRVDGKAIDVEVIAKTINSTGEMAFQIIFTDITEKKHAREEKEKLTTQLIDRNQELAFQEEELRSTNEELLTNKEELEKTLNELSDRNFELDQLVYKISHDLRSPLSTILGLVNIIKIEEIPDKKDGYINLIETRVHKLDGFIRSMLNYAKANRTEITLQNIDFEELIISCKDDMEYLSYFDKIAIKIQIDKNTKNYQGDLLRLRILFSNIISNAYKYHNPYLKKCFLKINIQKDNEQLVLQFIDNGIGIEKKHLHKIFDMFYRATTHSDGSGLGMYIVKQTIDKLKGTILIQSEYGKGTEIKIYLPF